MEIYQSYDRRGGAGKQTGTAAPGGGFYADRERARKELSQIESMRDNVG
jgi:hypothetical protein